uniref:UTP--glucose-1-phosphate uridylyltransferase n=1 Tax=Candidatus Aschnera chinzeii TaxID=1485666 RepID=A0AAT9G424_9ENTR|nr:MAG: UTP--glucose-1-phosphate uridylyltransferase GalU [Candidatus Aschnera chinzeii]
MKKKKNNKKITKAVIPVAGLGTRMLPATKAIPKEMLPLADQPLIQYVVNECVNAGIYDIVLVTNSSKKAIENHFDKNHALDNITKNTIKKHILNNIKSICPDYVTFMQTRQKNIKGLGHAVLCAKSLIGENPFALVLPDVVIEQNLSKVTYCNLKTMIRRYYDTHISQILVKPIPKKYIPNYGIVECYNYQFKPYESKIIKSIIEKPATHIAPSNLSVVGRYIFSENIWPLLKNISGNINQEIQLTDAINMLIKREPVEAFFLKGQSYDCGNKLGYMQAFTKYSMKHKIFGHDFSKWIKKIQNY